MANKKTKAAAKKATATKPETKVIRRRNEKNEVVEIEVPVEPIEKARVRVTVETKDSLLEKRKIATKHLESISGSSEAERRIKANLGKGIAAIDSRLKRFES